jgi:hypothetical protein
MFAPSHMLPCVHATCCRYGKRVPDAFYFWVAVNVSRLGPNHDAAKEIPGAAKSVGDQFRGVLKVQVTPKDYGPATKLLPTLQVCTLPGSWGVGCTKRYAAAVAAADTEQLMSCP